MLDLSPEIFVGQSLNKDKNICKHGKQENNCIEILMEVES